MRKLVILGVWMSAAALTLSAADLPGRFAPGSLDEGLVMERDARRGVSWSAWAYRNGAEYDLALAWAGADGTWSEPLLLGVGDGVDQRQPALAVDGPGNVYVAWADADRVLLMTLPAGAGTFTAPLVLTPPDERGRQPVLRVIGNRLAVAYRAAGEIRILDLPLLTEAAEPVHGFTIIDNPDPVENVHGVRGTAGQTRRGRIADPILDGGLDQLALNPDVQPGRD